MKDPSFKTRVLGIPVSPRGVGSIHNLFSSKPTGKSLIVTFVNPYACFLDKQDSKYAVLLEKFDVVACDGIGMVSAAKASGCTDVLRESFDFTSLAGDVLQTIARSGLSLGLVGGKPGVSHHAAREMERKYPGLKINACYSGYGQDPEDARRFFVEHKTDCVICGMGAPLQEEFLVQLVSAGWRGIGFTCGGFLDQIKNGKDYYPAWVDRFNIRFLYRLLKEPRRLWRRYLIEYQVFIARYCQLQWNRVWLKVASRDKPVD